MKSNPYRITSRGHQRSNQRSDSIDELILNTLLYTLLNPNREPRLRSIGHNPFSVTAWVRISSRALNTSIPAGTIKVILRSMCGIF
jgi:hypothetical protein